MASELCDECWRFKEFKEACHFHWEGKRECSRFMNHVNDEEKFMTIIDNSYLF